jgi:hypothetical protein
MCTLEDAIEETARDDEERADDEREEAEDEVAAMQPLR